MHSTWILHKRSYDMKRYVYENIRRDCVVCDFVARSTHGLLYSAYFGDKIVHYEHISKCTTKRVEEVGRGDRVSGKGRAGERERYVKFHAIIQICGMLWLF